MTDKSATTADDARLVVVMGDEHVAGKRSLQREAIDLHDPGVLAIPGHLDVVRRLSGRLKGELGVD